jgi:lipoprotein-anchoring transpeptidase ErfK/SrfK
VQANARHHPFIAQQAERLRPGQYLWRGRAASAGPLFVVIDLSTQRATVYRNDVIVGVSTVSTGGRGRQTPTGVFTILEKEVVHRSRTYDEAPMPYMQRLTWKGIAMHAGHVPGYPSSHGCIRLPAGFAKQLYAVTKIGTPVMIRA